MQLKSIWFGAIGNPDDSLWRKTTYSAPDHLIWGKKTCFFPLFRLAHAIDLAYLCTA